MHGILIRERALISLEIIRIVLVPIGSVLATLYAKSKIKGSRSSKIEKTDNRRVLNE